MFMNVSLTLRNVAVSTLRICQAAALGVCVLYGPAQAVAQEGNSDTVSRTINLGGMNLADPEIVTRIKNRIKADAHAICASSGSDAVMFPGFETCVRDAVENARAQFDIILHRHPEEARQ